MPKSHTTSAEIHATFSQKWGDDPFTQLGHTQVPNALIEYSARLSLRSEECWLICCILRFKYSAENPCPKQEELAKLFGQSLDTIQRTLKKMETKRLLKVERLRDEGGRFTHTVYDFTALRYSLNECYYQDHPQERPTTLLPVSTTPQKCGVVHAAEMRSGSEREPRRRNAVWSMPHFCGVYNNDSKNTAVKEESKKENSSRVDPTVLPEPTTPSAAAVLVADAAVLVAELTANDVNRADAMRLAREKPEECVRQLAYLPYVTEFRKGRGAYLRSAIEGGYGAPPEYHAAVQRSSETVRQEKRREQQIEEKQREEAQHLMRQKQVQAYQGALSPAEKRLLEEEAVLRLKQSNPFLASRLVAGKRSPSVEATLEALILEQIAARLDAEGRD